MKKLFVACMLLLSSIASAQNEPQSESAFWEQQGTDIKQLELPAPVTPLPILPEDENGGVTSSAEEGLNQFLEQQIQRDTLEQLDR